MPSLEDDGPERGAGGKPMDPIRRSVITSCSTRSLSDFVCEIRAVSGVSRFDLFVLRDTDITDIEAGQPELLPKRRPDEPDTRTSTQILADARNFEPIANWIHRQLDLCNEERRRGGAGRARVAALATYFPEVSARSHLDHLEGGADRSDVPFRVAERAIANTARLALRLKKAGLMEHAVVEVVCGSILDRCRCRSCEEKRQEAGEDRRQDIVIRSERNTKIELLCDRLLDVVGQVRGSAEGSDPDWALALELEPGPNYVLNSKTAIDGLIALLRDDAKYEPLRRHVGLNVDIAHMNIAGVEARDLVEYRDWILHAHLCNHPGMHTRDQVVGVWIPVERYCGENYPYLRLLAEIDESSPDRQGRPFTRTVALELEGCSRINWVHRSLVAMKHMTEVLKHHRQELPLSHAEPTVTG